MDKIYVVTIDEEFEKSRVKTHVRTRKGKMERVKEFERKGERKIRKPHTHGTNLRTRSASDFIPNSWRLKPEAKRKWEETEKQGSGRAYWFGEEKYAKAFAEEKKKKGHAVTYDEGSKYVWHSFSHKKHSPTTKKVMAGIDPLSAGEY